ncbi:MAG: hypothetical protein AAB966_05745 [Patescibacteria group bacterium]|mgnify:CR=1 FL=1
MPFLLLTANLAMFLTILFKSSSLPPQIPIFYSRSHGETQLAAWWLILLIPLLLNFFFFLNSFIYKKYFYDNNYVKQLFYYLKLFLLVSFTAVFLKIIFLIS